MNFGDDFSFERFPRFGLCSPGDKWGGGLPGHPEVLLDPLPSIDYENQVETQSN